MKTYFLRLPWDQRSVLHTLVAILLALLLLGATGYAQVVNGDFEAAPAGTGWTIDAPANWMANGQVEFPVSGGNPAGGALIRSPSHDPVALPHLPTEGCVRQVFSCDSAGPGLCTISLQYKLDRIDAGATSGRVRIRINGVIMHLSPPTTVPWTDVTLQVPCEGNVPIILELCLQVDAGNHSWAARFDNVRALCQKLTPTLTALGLGRDGQFALKVEGREGRHYTVQGSDDLSRWESLTTGRIKNGSFNFADGALASKHFYQVAESSNYLAQILDVSPAAGSPGMTTRVRLDRPLFDARTPIRALIGGVPAHTRWIGAEDEVEVQVPNIPAGPTQITFRDREFDPAGAAPFEVLPARARQLVLAWAGGECRLLTTEARGGQTLTAAEPDHVRLAFDLVNEQGLIYAGSLLHPVRGRLEVVDDSERGQPLMHATRNLPDAVFALHVPNLPGPFTIRFYEAAAGVDLTTERGRAERRFVNEVTVKP